MAGRYPKEFREDVIRVARDRGPGETLEQIANDFGVHPVTLSKWLRQADIDEGIKPGVTRDGAAELREARRLIRRLEQENEVLRRAAAYLSQANPLGKRFFPLVRDLASSGVPAEVSPQVLGLGRSAYYRWLTRPDTDSELAEAYLANAIFDAHRDDPEFGYRFLFDEVTDAGHVVSEGTVWRICPRTAGGACSGRRSPASAARSAPRHTRTSCAATSPRPARSSCG